MNVKFKKPPTRPWNPALNKACYRGINKIVNNTIIENEYRCDILGCENYDSTLEENDYEFYYNLKIENNTDYERSDEELDFKIDRVWKKFVDLNTIESDTSYTGRYMIDHIFQLAKENLISENDHIDEMRKRIRETFKYKLNKIEFDSLCQEFIDMKGKFVIYGWRLCHILDDEEI